MGAVLSGRSRVPAPIDPSSLPPPSHVNAIDASSHNQDDSFPYIILFNGSHYDLFIASVDGQPMDAVLSQSLLYLNFCIEDDPPAVDSLLLPSRRGSFEGHLFQGQLTAFITVGHVIRAVLYSKDIISNLTLVLIDKYPATGKRTKNGRPSCERLSPTYIVTPFYCPPLPGRGSPTLFHDVRSIFREGLAVSQLTVGGFGKSITYHSVHVFTSPHRLSVYATQSPHGKSPGTHETSWLTSQESIFRDTLTVMPLIWRRPDAVISQIAPHYPDASISRYDVPVIRWQHVAGMDNPSTTLLCSIDGSQLEDLIARRERYGSIEDPALIIVFFAGTPYRMYWDLKFHHMTTAFARRIIEYFEAIIHDAARNFRPATPRESSKDMQAYLTPNRVVARYRVTVRRSEMFAGLLSRFLRIPVTLQYLIPQVKRIADAPYTRVPQVTFDGEQGVDAGGLLKELLVGIAADVHESGLLACVNKVDRLWSIAPECGVSDLSICQDLPSMTRITIYRVIGHLLAVSLIRDFKFPVALSPALLFLIMHCTVSPVGAHYYGEIQYSSTLMALKETVTQIFHEKIMGRKYFSSQRYQSYLTLKGCSLIATAITRSKTLDPFPDVQFGPWGVGVAALSLHPYDALTLYCLDMDTGSSNMSPAYLLFPDLEAIGMDGCIPTTLQSANIRTDTNLIAFDRLTKFYRKSGHMFRNLSKKKTYTPISLVSAHITRHSSINKETQASTVLCSDSSEKSEEHMANIEASVIETDADEILPRNKGAVYASHLAYAHIIGLVYYEACALADGFCTLLRMAGVNLANEQVPVTYILKHFYAPLDPVHLTRELILRHFRFDNTSPEEARQFVRICLALTTTEQASLLRFCTGIPYLESNVLVTVCFSLPKGFLPQGRTCANMLELPKKSSDSELLRLLQDAMEHMYYGFL
ncbi:Hypothetical protein GLP15_218 [Giardia lamblia P15]|uniref:HECT domain-containing protein n=1 Tax=Giardia intestinalis (strain P15) TaxID=658858 RepID=E1F1I9_GIAIA|nr:Hypothetical protein GLP15_218 [Giardia lamblia P15]